jgi:uncharacterized damage-inducible protein DinB
MTTLESLFAQKSWANIQLFDMLATLTAEKYAEPVHTAIRTLNHIYVVDCIFQAHLQGLPHGYTTTNTEATPELGELQFSVAETDAWYVDYASKVSPAQLSDKISFRFTDGDQGTMSREEILLHLITHGANHRGNVGQVLKALSLVPPRDLYTKFLHVSEPQRR